MLRKELTSALNETDKLRKRIKRAKKDAES